MSFSDDAVSVSSSDESFDDQMFARASKASSATYRGVSILSSNTDRKTVLVTGGAGFVGSHTAGNSLSDWIESSVLPQNQAYPLSCNPL